MIKILIHNVHICVPIAIVTLLSLGLICQAENALGGGESSLTAQSLPLQPLTLTLRDALTAVVNNNRCAPVP